MKNYPMNADVHCIDGRFGRSTHIILNPAKGQVTHLVVQDREPPFSERILPTRWIKEKTPDLILVDRKKEDVRTLDLFNQTDFIQRQVPHYTSDPKMILLWPYVLPAKKVMAEKIEKVPPGELAIRRGAKVRATDGRIGQVDEFLVDPQTCHITHLVLKEGLLWDKKHVTIPIAEIDRVEKKTVYLKLSRQAVRMMPAVPISQIKKEFRI